MTSFEIKNQAALRVTESAVDAEVVDLSNGDYEFSRSTRWIFVSYQGSLVVRMASGASANLGWLEDGTLLQLSVSAVEQAGTHANGIIGLF